ncbi:MAG: YbfB/YjiJ family MFS transporter [Acidimicrobiales bacterium]|nr:YbfB/YjiJ family MFS transporter [Acidimicrobiales bacterium]MYB83099.1 YbfB/YjiJ family MFS transporter [Acidimicrobiales bacterium]MYI11395.1 YbfB/YjiJ family MFS transporter [Acidimicrobiales bacterium]
MTSVAHADGFSRARRIGTLLILAASAAVSQSFGRFTYSLLYADMRDGFSLSNTVASALSSLNLLLYVVGSLVVALTVGRTGLSGAVRIGLTGNVVGLALLAWSPNVGVAAFALALTGFCAAGVWVGTPGLAAELLGPERRGAAAGWMTGGVGSGMVAAAAIDAFLSRTDGTPSGEAALVAADLSHPRNVYRIELVIGAAALIALTVAVRRWSRTPGRAGFAGARAALAKVPQAGRLITAYTLHAFVVTTVLTFIVAHLEGYAELFDARDATIAFSLIGVGSIAGGPIFGRSADRLGRRRTVTIGFCVSMISTVFMTAYPLLEAGGQALAWTAAFIFGTSFTGVIASIAARVSDSLSGDEFGAAYGVATILFGLGLAAGPQLGGATADWFDSFGPAFGLAVAACAAGIALTGWGDDPGSASAS